jgi:hypothetical protein
MWGAEDPPPPGEHAESYDARVDFETGEILEARDALDDPPPPEEKDTESYDARVDFAERAREIREAREARSAAYAEVLEEVRAIRADWAEEGRGMSLLEEKRLISRLMDNRGHGEEP